MKAPGPKLKRVEREINFFEKYLLHLYSNFFPDGINPKSENERYNNIHPWCNIAANYH